MKRIIAAAIVPMLASLASTSQADDGPRHARAGAVFTMTNEAEGNRVLAFTRHEDGSLGEPTSVATHGLGTGDSLGSQAALALTEDRRHLLVTNPGSDELSVFSVNGARLRLVETRPSLGDRPVSVAEDDGVVYVVHAGTPTAVQGFWLGRDGHLVPIPGSAQPLSGPSVAPAQVAITPDGRELVVTEKATQTIATFRLSAWGRASAGTFNHAAGATPFGFDISGRGDVVVSEAGAGGLSSYAFSRAGGFSRVTGPVSDGERAACWVAISPDDAYAFTANAGSGSISSYAIDRRGGLSLVAARAGVTGDGSAPLDLGFGGRGRYLYVIARGLHTIESFDVDGATLSASGSAGPLTPFASGIASY